MERKLKEYRNGNYLVTIDLSDGTKIRTTEEDEFVPGFAESMDINITNKCKVGCTYCYQGCTKDGQHAPLREYRGLFETMHPYTEVAINGNDLDHPDLYWFLAKLYEKNVIANLTIHQSVFMRDYEKIMTMQEGGIIHGIGVSVSDPHEDGLMELIAKTPNAVVHAICGLVDANFLMATMGIGIKLLLLGYKTNGRGSVIREDYLNFNIAGLKRMFPWLGDHYDTIAFDTLAVEQLGLRDIFDKVTFEKYYAGDDGQFTFFLDLVDGKFAKSSIEEERMDINGMTVDEMFRKVMGLDR